MKEEALETLLEFAGKNVCTKIENDGLAAPLLLTQRGYELYSLEDYLDEPVRIRENVHLSSSDALIAYVKRFKDEASVIFAGEDSFTAVLDYHADPTNPSRCTHKATYSPTYSRPWLAWRKHNKKPMEQMDFALFLEERLDEIHKPSPADVLTAITKFRETAQHTFSSDRDLNTGEIELTFIKQNNEKKVTFPHEIQIELPVYEHHPSIRCGLRVRYRVNDGQALFWYQFMRDPTDTERNHFKNLGLSIRDELDDVPFFEGRV